MWFRDDLRYCGSTNKWYFYDGCRWTVDDWGKARTLVEDCMREFAWQAEVGPSVGTSEGTKLLNFALNSNNVGKVSAALRTAASHLPIKVSDLDTDPYSLNFRNGTVDLRTGTLRAHDRDDMISKLVKFNYDPDAKCPIFETALNSWMGGSEGLCTFMQRSLGYALTGSTVEKVMFFCVGKKDTGKTTLLKLFRDLLAEYSGAVKIDTLGAKRETNTTNSDLADLLGVRFAMTSETERGQKLSLALLKRLTQGQGKMKARRLHENHIEFPETHKTFADCNHLPIIRDDDNAVWERLRLVPFRCVVSSGQIDRTLPERLLSEAEGVLAWAVRGAVAWYSDMRERGTGLTTCREVEERLREYQQNEDLLGEFLQDRCNRKDGVQTRACDLYAAWVDWMRGRGEKPESLVKFADHMETKGYERKRKKRGVFYLDLELAKVD
jgi:putative DNA primase/helicase